LRRNYGCENPREAAKAGPRRAAPSCDIAELNPVVAAQQKSIATQPADEIRAPQTSRLWLWSQRDVVACGTMVARSQFMNKLGARDGLATSPGSLIFDDV
jgi:hypothetical protein